MTEVKEEYKAGKQPKAKPQQRLIVEFSGNDFRVHWENVSVSQIAALARYLETYADMEFRRMISQVRANPEEMG